MSLGDALRDLGNRVADVARDIGGSIGIGEGSGRSRSDRDRDRDRERLSNRRPEQRPSIMTVERDGQVQRVATRDIPRYGISVGDTTNDPDYSAFSERGLTGTDPGNVMRNIQGAERMARSARSDVDREDPEIKKGSRPAEAAVEPEVDPGEAKGARPTEEGTGESAAARARRLGLASTIATTPGGLLAGEGATRRRRSLMGGGLIR